MAFQAEEAMHSPFLGYPGDKIPLQFDKAYSQICRTCEILDIIIILRFIKTIYMLNCQTCQTLSTIGEQIGQRSANFDPICQLSNFNTLMN